MHPTQPPGNIEQRISHFAMPIVLCLAGFMAQASYAQIKAQLDRIEARQQADNVTIARLELRVLQLERIVGNNADSAVTPSVRHRTPR